MHCAFCTAVLLDDIIRCSGHGDLFNTDEACCGVGNRVINCLLNEKSGVLQYFCCRCRVRVDGERDAGGPVGTSFFDQLLKIAGVLSRRVSEMTSKLEVITDQSKV